MSKNNNQMVTFKKGKESRNQLELPTLHFIVTDQWTDVLSEKAIFAWLRMYSWCKRDEKDSDIDLWEQSKIPFSFKSVQKKLKVGSDTFYNKILKPLWNVGLIDIEEYEQSENKGTKPMNIIVYKYPQNNKALAYEPIEEIRNYDIDYHSDARTFAKKGGRPKKEGGSKIEHPQNIGGSETEHPPVLKENTPLFSDRTPPCSKIEHINSLNTINNNLNNISNNFNDINNDLNSFKKEEEEKINNARENNIAFEVLNDFLQAKGIDQKTIDKTILELIKRDLDLFLMENVEKQYEHMMEKLNNGEVDNHNGFAVYFANGLQMRSVQSKASKNYQMEKMREYEKAMRERKERLENSKLYNWLES